MRKGLVIIGIIFLLLSVMVFAQDDTAMTRQLNERLERNKAEIIKEIKDSTEQQKAQISISIDDNFGVLDERMQDFFKGTTRDIAVIVVAGFVGAFALSKVIQLKIESMRRKSNLLKMLNLSDKLVAMERRAIKLTSTVKQLEKMEGVLGTKIGDYKKTLKPQQFFNLKMIGFGVITFVVAFVVGRLI